jgi:GDSL-like Lipase/Acylhydrolase family
VKSAEPTIALEHSSAAAKRTSPGRIAAAYAAIALIPALIFCDTAAATLGGWNMESRLDRVAVGGFVIWLAAATALLAWPAGRRFYDRRLPQLVALAISVCGTWLVADLLLGPLLARVADPFHLRRPDLEFTYRPRPGIMRDVGALAHVRFNAWGVRGTDPPPRAAAYRVLCLGGSSTACTYLDDAKTWPHLLETDLHDADDSRAYWVGNAGLPGFRAVDHRRFVAESPIVDEIDCLVVQMGINDFMACLAGPRPRAPLWTNSRVWQLTGALARRYGQSGTLVEDTAGMVYERRRAVRAVAEIADAPPPLDECLGDFADELRGITDACRARGVRLVFTTQATLWREDLDAENAALLWFGQMRDGRFLSIGQLRRGIDRYNATLKAVCRERGVELVDLGQLDGDPAMFYDDCHFTETGARHAAQIVAAALTGGREETAPKAGSP